MAKMTRLNVSLTMGTAGFKKSVEGVGKSMDKLVGGIASAAKKLISPVSIITGGLTSAAFVAGIKRSATAIDNLAKSADRLGISTESLVGLRHAASIAGASVQDMDNALKFMMRNISEAAQGIGEARDAFRLLGVDVNKLRQMSPEDQFSALADALNNVTNQSDKVAAAMDIFGRSGINILNTAEMGSEGLAKMRQEAEDLGIAISRADASKVEEANDAMTRLGRKIEGMFARITIELAPFIESIVNAITDATWNADDFGKTVVSVMERVARGVVSVVSAFETLNRYLTQAQFGFAGLRTIGNKVGLIVVTAMQNVVEAIGTIYDVTKPIRNLFFDYIVKPFSKAVSFIVNSVGKIIYELLDLTRIVQLFGFEKGLVSSEAVSATERNMDKVSGLMDNTGTAIDDLVEKARAGTEGAVGAGLSVATASMDLMKATMHAGARQAAIVEEEMALRWAQAKDREGEAAAALEKTIERIKTEAEQRAAAMAQELQERQDFAKTKEAMDAEVARREQERKAIEEAAEIARRERRIQAYRDEYQSLQDIARQGDERREAFSQMTWDQQTRTVFGSLEKMTRGVSKHSKVMFEINKIAGVANAIMNTAEAVTLNLRTYPGPLGATMAGIAAAAGAVQINTIKSQTFGGGGSAPSVAASNPAPAPTGGGVGTPETSASRPTQDLVLVGEIFSVDQLVELHKEARERGYDIGEIRRG